MVSLVFFDFGFSSTGAVVEVVGLDLSSTDADAVDLELSSTVLDFFDLALVDWVAVGCVCTFVDMGGNIPYANSSF